MLTRIECDGFRTLSNFSLDIKPGVNLLLGPNGAGKTNIINLLDFVGKATDMPLSEAVSQLGGAGSIFRKSDHNKYESTVRIILYGYTKISGRTYFRYKIDLEIKLTEDRDAVVYSYQQIIADKCTKSKVHEKEFVGDVRVSVKTDNNGRLKFESHVDKKKITNPYTMRDFDKHLSEVADVEDSLLQLAPRVAYQMWSVWSDISGGLSLNVIPSRAKEPEDSTAIPKIQPDGSGLYATLRAAAKSAQQSVVQRRRMRIMGRLSVRRFEQHIPEDAYEKILAAAKFANSSISEINIHNDAFDNKLKGSVVLSSNGSKTELPIAAMSDGTVKWFVLVTAIYTGSKMLSIEEPENYLHPLVQMEIIKMFREEYASENFVLVSSHSETLLNAVKPEEVVLVEFVDGRTVASRASNAREISREIRRTGFGLGFYYVSGALEATS